MKLNLYRVKAHVDDGMERFNASAYIFAASAEDAKAYFRQRFFKDDIVDIYIAERIDPKEGLVL